MLRRRRLCRSVPFRPSPNLQYLLVRVSGGPTAAVMAYQNPHLNITVVDRDPCRISAWNSKHLPIYEPGLSSILRIAHDGSKAFSFPNSPFSPQSLESMSRRSAISKHESYYGGEIHIPARRPNLFFSTEVAHCISEADIILIAVNTPTKARGLGAGRATDLTALEALTREIAINAKPGAILVEKSTVPCRTAEIIQDTVCPYPFLWK
jgi:UDPglucose 6-dehydrogenase